MSEKLVCSPFCGEEDARAEASDDSLWYCWTMVTCLDCDCDRDDIRKPPKEPDNE